MKNVGTMKQAVRFALVPVLAAAVSLGTGFAQDHGHDDHGNQGHGQQAPGNDQGKDFHFRDQDRGQFSSHYQGDVNKWRGHPQGRPHFERGQRIPANYRFQPVPSSYYRGMPPPPRGYQYGYYGGYVVAYNPTTRIVGDVLDLVATAAR
jgi:Ni/Co efflux regulator RcnB